MSQSSARPDQGLIAKGSALGPRAAPGGSQLRYARRARSDRRAPERGGIRHALAAAHDPRDSSCLTTKMPPDNVERRSPTCLALLPASGAQRGQGQVQDRLAQRFDGAGRRARVGDQRHLHVGQRR